MEKDLFQMRMFLRSTGAIMTHNTPKSSFVVFPSNRCRWFRVHPKNRCHHLAGRFHRLRLQKPTVLTVPFSLECSSLSMFRPQLYIDEETRQDCDGKAPKQPRVDYTIEVILLWEQTRHPSCRDFFHTQFCMQNQKHCTLRYAFGLNYKVRSKINETELK